MAFRKLTTLAFTLLVLASCASKVNNRVMNDEPIFDTPIFADEPVRYGPNATDTTPVGCEGDQCKVTVIEYSEFQCPYCKKDQPDSRKILQEYKGKIRWYVRDFPLDFHDRAMPAAIAAKCSSFQNKYWDMYFSLFENQRDLSDEAIRKRAVALNLRMSDFDECYQSPKSKFGKKARELINRNFESGKGIGVEGTPTFFINGKKYIGAVTIEGLKGVIEN